MRKLFSTGVANVQPPVRDEQWPEAMDLAATLFAHAREGMLLLDERGRIRRVNPAFTRCFGFSERDLSGRHWRVLRSGCRNSGLHRQMSLALRRRGYWEGELYCRDRNGRRHRTDVSLARLEGGAMVALLGSDDGATVPQQARYAAGRDLLTGLPDRYSLIKTLSERTQAAEPRPMAVLFIDLDRFKHINDSLGHLASDTVLVEFAERLQHRLRREDFVARVGGDEFVVAIEAAPDETLERLSGNAHEAAARILAIFDQSFTAAGREVFLSASIGLSLSDAGAADLDRLLGQADQAMYRAQALGGNQFMLYRDELSAQTERLIRLDAKLHRAIEREELVLHYQPVIDLASGRLAGVEALLRWNNQGNMIAPSEFIPLAEETGLIVPIGEWVLFESCRQVARWRERCAGLYVAVNLSPRQFSHAQLVEKVAEALALFSLPGAALELEITESAASQCPLLRVREKIMALRELGIGFAIDDFGTGHSSLSRLIDFPIDTLKIDRSFVARLPTAGHPRTAITRNLIALAHDLGLRVVAEGVESQAQRRYLAGQGCDLAQGYLFSRPRPARDIDLIIASETQG